MQKHNFSIVRSVRLRVDHSLLALPGAKLSEIREVVSHGQALEQCSEFLKQLPNATVTRCENTAAAARMVAGAGRRDLAAIASPACAEIYGLQPLQERVQNEHGNYTRFICIAAKPEVYPGADRTSLLVTLSNEPGSLYQVLARIYGRGINLTKLESRPIPGSDDTFRAAAPTVSCPASRRSLTQKKRKTRRSRGRTPSRSSSRRASPGRRSWPTPPSVQTPIPTRATRAKKPETPERRMKICRRQSLTSVRC